MEMRWSQADILLIMEEIERAGTPSIIALLAARHNLALTYARLIEGSRAALGYPANLPVINAAIHATLGGAQGLVETEIASVLARLGESARSNAAVMASADSSLNSGDAPAQLETLPDAELSTALADFDPLRPSRPGGGRKPLSAPGRGSAAGAGEHLGLRPRPAPAVRPHCHSLSRRPGEAAGRVGSRHKMGRALLQRAG